jgi:hypothetical protein
MVNQLDPASVYLKSNFYEQLVEHVFISELLQEAWYRYGVTVEVLRSEIDSSGYDIVFECNGIVRHVQMKTSAVGARAAHRNVNIALAGKPSGCILWVFRDEDLHTCRMKLTYRFFGAAPGRPLPDLNGYRVGKHPKGNAQGIKSERPDIRLVPRGAFVDVGSTTELLDVLFGLR